MNRRPPTQFLGEFEELLPVELDTVTDEPLVQELRDHEYAAICEDGGSPWVRNPYRAPAWFASGGPDFRSEGPLHA